MLVKTAVSGHGEHVAPHAAVEAVFRGDRKHFLKVFRHDLRPRNDAVFVQKSAVSEGKGFIHADVDLSQRERLCDRGEHLVDQFVSFRFPDEQNVVDIADPGVPGIAEDGTEVSERLDAGDQLDVFRFRVSVHFADLRDRKPPAHIAEIRFAFHLVGILGVKHDRIITESG